MGLFSKDIKTFEDLFVHTLQDIYYAENRIAKALPGMIAKTSDAELKARFEQHLGETKNHLARLEQVFQMIGEDIEGTKCAAIDGIIAEADEVTGEIDDRKVLDAALIAAAQAVEHYEITRYGTLIAWAKEAGHANCTELLRQTLDEEKATDMKLSALALQHINSEAV